MQSNVNQPTYFSGNNVLPVPSSQCYNTENTSNAVGNEPRLSLPFFNGKHGRWESFWIQFCLIADRYNWDDRKRCANLLLCLRDEAIIFAGTLPEVIRESVCLLQSALKKRFGDNTHSATYRANLTHIKRKQEETVQEYAMRVQTAVDRAYPGMAESSTITEITVEHIAQGLADPSLTYDVLSRKPKSVSEAIELVSWLECCKSSLKRKPYIRQVGVDTYSSETDFSSNDVDVRKIDKSTEKRWQSMISDLTQEMKDFKNSVSQEIKDIKFNSSESKTSLRHWDEKEPRGESRQKFKGTYKKPVECFYCHEEGHFIKDCIKRQKKREKDQDKDRAAAPDSGQRFSESLN